MEHIAVISSFAISLAEPFPTPILITMAFSSLKGGRRNENTLIVSENEKDKYQAQISTYWALWEDFQTSTFFQQLPVLFLFCYAAFRNSMI